MSNVTKQTVSVPVTTIRDETQYVLTLSRDEALVLAGAYYCLIKCGSPLHSILRPLFASLVGTAATPIGAGAVINEVKMASPMIKFTNDKFGVRSRPYIE